MSFVVPYKKHPCCWVDKVNGNKTSKLSDTNKNHYDKTFLNCLCFTAENFSIFLSLCITFRVLNIFWLSIFTPLSVPFTPSYMCVSIWDWFSLWYDHVVEYKKKENFLWPTLSFFIMHSLNPLCWQWFDSVEKKLILFFLHFNTEKFNRW